MKAGTKLRSEIRNSNSIVTRNRAKTIKNRRCRTDMGGKDEIGLYYANILISSLAAATPNIRPIPPLLDVSLNSWILDNHARRVGLMQKSESTAILYITFVPLGKTEADRVFNCSSWWILEHNGKKVGVSALHALDDADITTVEFYISKSPLQREGDLFSYFETLQLSGKHRVEFDSINLRLDLLEERHKWLETNQSNIPYMQQHNLDPEFGLEPHPVVDILFTTIPESMSNYLGFKVADNGPQENSIFGHLGFHNEHEPTEEGVYNETVTRPPKANKLLFGGRSVSLGRVNSTGSILTVLSTNAEGSSGGCMVNDDMDVFAISFGSFYDDPGADDNHNSNLSSNPLLMDVDIPEKGDPNSRAPRNRNLALSLFHPGVQACLQKI